MECIFCAIAHKELTTPFLYEDEQVAVFHTRDPEAPVHEDKGRKMHVAKEVEAPTTSKLKRKGK